MQWLLEQLTKPQILPDGIVRQPTPIMLKAAQVIMDLSKLFETDKNGRTKAEQQYIATHNQLVETESLLRIAGDQLTRAERNLNLKDKEIESLKDRIIELNIQLQEAKYKASNLTGLLEYQSVLNEDNIRSLT